MRAHLEIIAGKDKRLDSVANRITRFPPGARGNQSKLRSQKALSSLDEYVDEYDCGCGIPRTEKKIQTALAKRGYRMR